jgi:hypothetical protein
MWLSWEGVGVLRKDAWRRGGGSGEGEEGIEKKVSACGRGI